MLALLIVRTVTLCRRGDVSPREVPEMIQILHRPSRRMPLTLSFLLPPHNTVEISHITESHRMLALLIVRTVTLCRRGYVSPREVPEVPILHRRMPPTLSFLLPPHNTVEISHITESHRMFGTTGTYCPDSDALSGWLRHSA
jgi:hypothetical protein